MQIQFIFMREGERMFELVVIWEDGDKNIYPYESEELAKQGQRNMCMAFGRQIAWSGVRKGVK